MEAERDPGFVDQSGLQKKGGGRRKIKKGEREEREKKEGNSWEQWLLPEDHESP